MSVTTGHRRRWPLAGPGTMAPAPARAADDPAAVPAASAWCCCCSLIQPGILTGDPRLGDSTIRFATPLALLAACQTLAMLTGGIDLSVATVATMAAFVMATQSASQGDAVAILLGSSLAALVGPSTASASASSGCSR